MIVTRSRIAACAALAAALLSAPAMATYCTNGALQTSYPKCDKFPTPATPAATSPTSSSTSSTTAASNAQAAAQANAAGTGYGGKGGAGGAGGSASAGSSTSTSAGGSVGATTSTSAGGSAQQSLLNTSPSSSTLTDASTSVSRSLSLFLPPPVFTPPMAKIDCPSAHITQTADAQLWSGFSQARAETDPTDCTLIQLRNAKVETCQYATAKQIEDLMLAKHLKNFKANVDVKFTDYDDKDCAVLKAPPKVEMKPESSAILYTLPPQTVPEFKMPEPVKKKAPAKKVVKKADPVCPSGQAQQCVVKK